MWPLSSARRKQMIEEYFETENEVDSGSLAADIAPSQPVGIIRQDPSTPERHYASSLGSDSFLVHGRQHRIQDHQRPRGNGRG